MNKIFTISAFALLSACATTNVYNDSAVHSVVVEQEVCSWQNVPVYSTITRPATSGEIAVGALIGGVIGDAVGRGDDGATVVGAIVGGALASGPSTQRVITGYTKQWQCRTVYR